MPLNDRQIKSAKPAAKPYKLNDGSGLYLQITPAGGKLWRFDYALHSKRKTLSIGKYPAVSLVEARQAADAARSLLAQGIDPAAAKQADKAERLAAQQRIFERLACEWHAANLHRWKPNHAARIMDGLQKDVLPYIGKRQIDDIAVADVKAVIERIAARGAFVTAEKARQWIGAVYGYAAMLEMTDRNPAAPLRGLLAKPETRHMPALPASELTEFYRRLLLADIDHKNRLALLLLMLVFVRSGELRGADWGEIDRAGKLWTVPAERMKMKRSHTVPLSDWALELLDELHGMTGQGRFLFPSRTATNGVMSDATLTRIMERMGYKGRATPHGFRSLASTVLNEQGFNPDAIERQLAHVPGDRIRAAYNRADYLAERQSMMQWWSDFLRRHYDAAATLAAADR